MRIQLDTISKTIKLESSVQLGELVKTLEKLLPKGEWKEFTLETHTTINNWSTPYVIEKIKEVPVYPTPWRNPFPWISYYSSNSVQSSLGLKQNMQTAEYKLQSGVFNIDCKTGGAQ